MSDEDPRGLWQSQPMEATGFTIVELRRKASEMDRLVSRRNRVEYLAALVVVAIFSFYMYWFPKPTMRVGSGLIIAAAVFTSWHLRRHGESSLTPAAVGQMTSAGAYRRELERQRDLLRSVWLWYLAPFLPGLVIFSWGAMSMLAFCLVVFAVIGYLNYRAARALQREIDQLNDVEKAL